MPCWYYDKKDLKLTPSIKDGISFETERRYRKEGARFIMECGTAMSLGHNTMATGVVYFHRFYMFHSFKTFPRYVTACCCLLLAGKVEETPKKCRDIIKTARSSLNDDQFYSFGDDPKEEVMTLERILLQTIKFDLQVEHPYGFLVKYAKCFKVDQNKLQKIVQMAWNFVNDSLSTTVCLQWEPEIIAVALIHLATKLSKFSVTDWEGKQPNHQRWWDMFVADVTMDILEDICHQVLDLYQKTNNRETPSPPQKPPSKASPPPVKRPITPPSSSSKTSPLPLQTAAITKIQQDDISDNNTPSKIFPIESVPPTRMYPPNYGNIYPAHPSSSYGGMTSGGPAPPPPQPPLYGQQYAPPPQVTSHYAGSSMASTSHHSAPSHPSSHYSSSSAHHQNLPPHHQQPPLPSHHGVSTGHNPIPPGHHTLSGSHHPPTYYTSAAPHNRSYYPP